MISSAKLVRLVESWIKAAKEVKIDKVITDGVTYVVDIPSGPAMICGKETMDTISLEQYKTTECPVKHIEHERG